ncbi:hypothetical protein MLD38_019826 [Melastoma candidum]|nr:hypothetical protein MLD38_019826 [Melastoma candidum]
MAFFHKAAASCFALLFLLLLCFLTSSPNLPHDSSSFTTTKRGRQLLDQPCDEIYVVGEGETLHTIGDKCGDPFIVERNPHIQDPDDVFPGLVIKITTPPNNYRKLLR